MPAGYHGPGRKSGGPMRDFPYRSPKITGRQERHKADSNERTLSARQSHGGQRRGQTVGNESEMLTFYEAAFVKLRRVFFCWPIFARTPDAATAGLHCHLLLAAFLRRSCFHPLTQHFSPLAPPSPKLGAVRGGENAASCSGYRNPDKVSVATIPRRLHAVLRFLQRPSIRAGRELRAGHSLLHAPEGDLRKS